MTKLRAFVQYDDLKGTVAADRADRGGPQRWLRDKNLINDDEYVVGISMFAGENHGVHRDPISVDFLVSELKGYDNIPETIQSVGEPIEVKRVQVDMNLIDFFGLFKRFAVTLSTSGMLEGIEYTSI